MIRGADKEIRDQRGHTPLDLVNNREVETENLANDLRKMLVSSRGYREIAVIHNIL